MRLDLRVDVGPRPEQVDLVERYTDYEKAIRLGSKPGLTGPFQAYGRSRLSWQERLNVERSYVDCPSLSNDLRILMLTFPTVFHRDGAF